MSMDQLSLRDRCLAFYQRSQSRAITRTGSPVDEISSLNPVEDR